MLEISAVFGDESRILRAFHLDVLVHLIRCLRIDEAKRFQWTLCSFFKGGVLILSLLWKPKEPLVSGII